MICLHTQPSRKKYRNKLTVITMFYRWFEIIYELAWHIALLTNGFFFLFFSSPEHKVLTWAQSAQGELLWPAFVRRRASSVNFLAHLSTKCSGWAIVTGLCPSSCVVRRASCGVRQLFYLNIFSSETTHWILTKLHRNDPWVVLPKLFKWFWLVA